MGIWPDGGDAAADWRALQRKQEEYARELDRQIELRRAAQREEQRAREELERRLQPAERSPSKWLVDGGRVDDGAATDANAPSQWERRDAGEAPGQQQMHGVDTGELAAAAAPSPFMRFRVTDESQASERLRERAQQLEWKRVLDEQVRENARLRAAQEEEKRRADQEAAQEEVQFLREQQLRAQRKLGYASPSPSAFAPTTSRHEYRAIPDPQVETSPPMEDVNAASRVSARRKFQISENSRTYAEPNSYKPSHYGAVSGTTGLPPPAPSRSYAKNSFAPVNATTNNAYSGNKDDGGTENDGASSSYNYQQSRLDVIEQYRSLLNEIRREREELRREREEVRREKEELRIQRALLELENEKMASLVDAQRRLAEQQLERQERDAQAMAQFQRQQQMEMALQVPDTIPGDVDRLPTPSITPLRSSRYAQVNNIRDSLTALKINDATAAPEAPTPQRRRASPMSMAEFTTAGNVWGRPALSPVKSPSYPRHSAGNLRQQSQMNWVDEFEESEQPLDQSLVGESVFVPVEPLALNISATLSPSARYKATDNSDPRSPLRNSRVIKSRGFYDLSQEFEPPARSGNTPAKPRVSARHQEQKYEEESGEEEDYDGEDAAYVLSGASNSRIGDMFAVEDSPYRGDGSWASDSDYDDRELDRLVRGDIDEEAKDNVNAASRANGDSSRRSSAASGLFKVQVLL